MPTAGNSLKIADQVEWKWLATKQKSSKNAGD